jgi:hypothetical protein
MKNNTVLNELVNALVARTNCQKANPPNTEWETKWDARIQQLIELLPSGSGFDTGTQLDEDRNFNPRAKVVFNTAFHHMNDGGMYNEWTEHTITVKPCLLFGYSLTISGRDKNDIKDYINDMFHFTLDAQAPSPNY